MAGNIYRSSRASAVSSYQVLELPTAFRRPDHGGSRSTGFLSASVKAGSPRSMSSSWRSTSMRFTTSRASPTVPCRDGDLASRRWTPRPHRGCAPPKPCPQSHAATSSNGPGGASRGVAYALSSLLTHLPACVPSASAFLCPAGPGFLKS